MDGSASTRRGRSALSLRLSLSCVLSATMAFSSAATMVGRVSPGGWAASICEAIDDWASEIDDREVDAYPIEEDDPRLERKHLRALFEAELEETENLLGNLEDAGEPDTEGGKTIAGDLRRAFRQLRSGVRQLLRDAIGIVGPNRQAFLDKRAALARNVADTGVDLYDDLAQVASTFPSRLTRAISGEACDPFEEWALYFGDVASDLIEGDCFSEVPGGPEPPSGNQFVAVVPCPTTHTSEAFADVEFSEPSGAEYPGDAALSTRATEECHERFDNYVGSESESSSLQIRYVYPSTEDWELDDRAVTCILIAPDGISESAKASAL